MIDRSMRVRRARSGTKLVTRFCAAIAALSCAMLASAPGAPAAQSLRAASPAAINGSGSTYVGLAMTQWTADAQSLGLTVNYTPTGSPDGLSRFSNGGADFAGTEAEFASLGQVPSLSRGFQYVPDVAGAVAIMYNVEDRAGRRVDYLHLSRETIAKIFTGAITHWSDPAITADNQGAVKLPDQPINVVYRSSPSGTTALFYDFIAHIDPALFNSWAQRNGLPTNVRIIDLSVAPNFTPKNQGIDGSDQIAQFVGGSAGKWSIAYDEFGYARTYQVPTAWVQDANGDWVLPYARNISIALQDAHLRPDLSQELSGVYNSRRPRAYPISAYSYLVTQCSASNDRPSCRGNYTDAGKAETLSRWMRYIACEGQRSMAAIGYSPLPPNLSQEIANSIGRMNGKAPESLNTSNCANPRFGGDGNLPDSPIDPYVAKGVLPASPDAPTAGGNTPANQVAGAQGAKANASSQTAGSSGQSTRDATKSSNATALAAGRAGAVGAIGGSGIWRNPDPVAYRNPASADQSTTIVIAFVLVLLLPIIAGTILSRLRRRNVCDATVSG